MPDEQRLSPGSRRVRRAMIGRIPAVVLLTLASTWLLCAQSVPDVWMTAFEVSGGKRTPRYGETMEYCRRLDEASPWISMTSFGRSPEGRELALVIAAKGNVLDPEDARASGKTIVMIQNGIHAGEIDGKDACLMLLRDIAITKTRQSLLDSVILLIIPIFNVDGHERFGPYGRINQNGPEEMGWRVTSQNLNLNRDYMKADSPEMQAFLTMFNAWLPDFFIDCHVTDGADYRYIVTYGLEMHENLAHPVRRWLAERYIPEVIATVRIDGTPVSPYVFFADDRNPALGLRGGTAPPRFSTSYIALHNRPALLIETHMLKDYRTRVYGTYTLLERTIEFINRDHSSLREANNRADRETERSPGNPFPLRFETVDTPTDTLAFLGYRFEVDSSDISGTTRIRYIREPRDLKIPRFDNVRVTTSVEPPVAYLIPPQWTEVIARLARHGLALERLTSAVTLDVEAYTLTRPQWREMSYEGHHTVSYQTERKVVRREFPAGTAVVRLNQRAAKVAIHALEPEAPDAFVAWGFFDTIFEQKEYAEDYVMEEMAREMLAKEPSLRSEFETKLRSDSSFAKSPHARLNFFYQRSSYWDSQLSAYPVARLMTDVPLPTGRYP